MHSKLHKITNVGPSYYEVEHQPLDDHNNPEGDVRCEVVLLNFAHISEMDCHPDRDQVFIERRRSVEYTYKNPKYSFSHDEANDLSYPIWDIVLQPYGH